MIAIIINVIFGWSNLEILELLTPSWNAFRQHFI